VNGLKLAGWGVAVGLIMCTFAAAGTGKPRAKLADHKTHPPAKPAPAAEIPPPSQNSSKPPPRLLEVSWENGLLSISAQNADLRDLLDEIHNCTGALVVAPADASERVAVHLGPGPPASVVAALLEGSRYNYVIVGTANDPPALQNITLTAKPPLAAAFVAKQPPAREDPPVQSRAAMRANLTGGDEGASDEGEAVLSDAPMNPELPSKPN
jgi:hypothetical protein